MFETTALFIFSRVSSPYPSSSFMGLVVWCAMPVVDHVTALLVQARRKIKHRN